MPKDKTLKQKMAEKQLRERLRMGRNPLTGEDDRPKKDNVGRAKNLAQKMKELVEAPGTLLKKAANR